MVFKGEDEYWRAEVKVTQTDNREDRQIVLKYKGLNISSVKTSNYKITSANGESSATGMRLNKGGILEARGCSAIGGTLLTENDKLTVTIEWNDHSETFSLIHH